MNPHSTQKAGSRSHHAEMTVLVTVLVTTWWQSATSTLCIVLMTTAADMVAIYACLASRTATTQDWLFGLQHLSNLPQGVATRVMTSDVSGHSRVMSGVTGSYHRPGRTVILGVHLCRGTLWVDFICCPTLEDAGGGNLTVSRDPLHTHPHKGRGIMTKAMVRRRVCCRTWAL